MAKLVLNTAASELPLRTDQVATWLRESNPQRFGVVEDLLKSAVATLQKEHWTQFCTATYDQYYDAWPAERFRLDKNPPGTVASVKYYDSDSTLQTISSSVWEQDIEDGWGIVRLAYDQSWPSDLRGHPNDIVINFTCGYGTAADVPEPIKQALKIWVAQSYASPEAMSTLRLSKMPVTVDALMANYTYRTVG